MAYSIVRVTVHTLDSAVVIRYTCIQAQFEHLFCSAFLAKDPTHCIDRSMAVVTLSPSAVGRLGETGGEQGSAGPGERPSTSVAGGTIQWIRGLCPGVLWVAREDISQGSLTGCPHQDMGPLWLQSCESALLPVARSCDVM
jgi:hypothetical protein